jgi:hypothetical protein
MSVPASVAAWMSAKTAASGSARHRGAGPGLHDRQCPEFTYRGFDGADHVGAAVAPFPASGEHQPDDLGDMGFWRACSA